MSIGPSEFTHRVQDLVLKRSDEASSLVVALSSTEDQIEGRVDAVVANIGGPD
jgi:hypothetical protein